MVSFFKFQVLFDKSVVHYTLDELLHYTIRQFERVVLQFQTSLKTGAVFTTMQQAMFYWKQLSVNEDGSKKAACIDLFGSVSSVVWEQRV